MIKMIIATDKNFGIGKDNSIPWNSKEDMKYFKEHTENSIVIMGKNTYKSLPFENGLPNRTNYVLSNSLSLTDDIPNVCQLGYVTDMKRYCLHTTPVDVWVIGGASIYRQLLPFVEEIHHTIIDEVYDCDTHFNMEFLEDWELVGGKDLCENAVVNIWRRN